MELDREAVRMARRNASFNGVQDATFMALPAEEGLKRLADFGEASTMSVIVDPPRAGLSDAAVHALLEFAPRRMTYVSCDYRTQSRDLRGMVRAGYRVQSV